MSNSQNGKSVSTLIEQKARILLKNLNKEYSELRSNEQEEILLRYNNVYRTILNTAATPLTQLSSFKKGITVEASALNLIFQSIQNDLQIIFNEMEHLSLELRDTYNTLLTKESRLRSKIAEATSSILDYTLLNQDNSMNIIKDNFFNLNKQESNKDKYKKAIMFLDSDTGLVTLPHAQDDKEIEIESISINPLSNGVLGNNQEINAIRNSDLKMINDGNSDTWVEYEHVQKEPHTSSLIFNFELKFKEVTFFNLLEVGVNAFPNGSAPVIAEIEGSVDGNYYIDMMSDFLGETVIDSRGQEIIQLGASEENPQDLNSMLFFPRKIKYLRIKMIQDSDFLIRTPSFIKHRIAIGIKEISCKGIKFKNEGEFQSVSFPLSREVQKVLIETSEFIPEGFNITNSYELSVDAGQTWNKITPLNKTNLEIPEILTYNMDSYKDSINTPVPVRNLKFKFNSKIEIGDGDSSKKSVKTLIKKSEFQTVAGGVQEIILKEQPEENIEIFHVGFGSVGEGKFYMIPQSDFFDREDHFLAKLPLEVFSRGKILKDTEVLYIEDIIWTRVDNLLNHESTERVYEFDYLNNHIYFNREKITPSGNSDPDIITRHGKKPLGNIYFKLKAERPKIEELNDSIQLETLFSHNGIKKQIKVYEREDELQYQTIRLTPYSQTQKTVEGDIESYSITLDNNLKMQNEKTFINGYNELTSAGDYSIDLFKGMIYLYEVVQPEDIIEIEFSYRKRIDVDFSIKNKKIGIKKSDYKDRRKKETIDTNGSHVSQLSFFPVKRGSIKILKESPAFQTEVPFLENENSFNGLDNSDGCYAVDYLNGRILTPEIETLQLEIDYLYYDYFVEYGISLIIPSTSYSIIKNEKKIIFSDDFVLRFFSDSLGLNNQKMFKINYEYLAENIESPSEILPFLTPILHAYKIKLIFKDE